MLSFVFKPPEDSSAQIVVAGVSKKEAEPGLRMLQATEPSINGFRQLNNQESPVETPGKQLKFIVRSTSAQFQFPNLYLQPFN